MKKKSTRNRLRNHKLAIIASTVFLTIGSAHAADAVFSSANIGAGNNDANVGLLSTKTYINAVNLEGGALTINGVNFEASSGANPSGTGYTITGTPNTFGPTGGTNNVTGQLGSLVDNFIFNGNPSVFTLTGLTAGQTYSLTHYNRAWDVLARTQNITTTSGATTAFNEDFNAVGDLNLLRYTFTASGTSETLNFTQAAAGTFHLYGFSTEQVFNNTWTSGADWTTATWSVSVPNAVGANADFTAQGAPTAINLDAAQTVGHVRFAGANAWTVSGANPLTLEADAGAVAVLAATSGTHTISAAVTLNSDVLKSGTGTVVLSGAITDNSKNVAIGAGTLELANAAALSLGGNFTGSGNLVKTGAGALTLTGNHTYTVATINAGTLEFAPTGAATYTGAIGGTSILAKSGAGTLTLTGTNTSTGATNISQGTLKLQNGSAPLFTDNFTGSGNPNTGDLNFKLANRQGGSAATQNWIASGNTQVGNPTNVTQPPGTSGDYLLLAFGAQARLAGPSLSTGNVPGPLKINVDIFKGNTGDPTEWTSFTLRTNGDGFPVAGSGELGFLYRNNTGIQIFNNGGLLQDFASTAGGDSFGFYLADSAGTGSPYAGNGTRVIVTQGGSILGSYALNTGMASSLIAFGSAGNMIGGVDNLSVNNFKTNVLDPAAAVSLTASGATLELDGVLQTVASLSGVSGSAVNLGPFSRLTVSGAASTSFDGVIAGTFGSLTKAGAGTLTLTGANTYTGVTTFAGGVLNVTSFSDYGVAGGLGNRAADNGGEDMGLLFRGGTLQYTGSTAQSTNRAIRINADGGGGNAGGATIDASGSVPSATLSFTATSSQNFFEFPGTRTLTLTGSNTGANTFAMAIGEAGGATSVVKSGAGTWVLTGANNYTGGTTVSAGTLQVGIGGTVGSGPVTNNATFDVARAGLTTAAISGTGSTSVTTASTTLTATSIRQSVLSIGATSQATISPSLGNKPAGISVFTNTAGTSLSIATGGNFDVNDNDLIVYYQAGQGATTLASIQQQIINGFLGTPAVAKISSSTGAVDMDKFLVAIDNGGLGLTTWEGVTLTGTDQIIVKYTLFGDLNLDGTVDSFDYSVIDSNFGTGNSWLTGDSNLDGMVDSFDYSTVDTNFGKSFPMMGGGAASLSIAAVPEPSTFVLGGLAVLGLGGYRLRRRGLKSGARA